MGKNNKNTIKLRLLIIVYLILLTVLLTTLTGCTISASTDNELLSDKIFEELTYLENNIYDIVFKFANDDYIVNEKISNELVEENENNENVFINIKVYDFDKVRNDLKRVNNALDVTLVDLAEKSIERNEVLSLSNKTNELYMNLDEENINIVLNDLNELEKVIIKNYESNFDRNNNEVKLKKIKAEVLNIFVLSQIYEDKTLAKERIGEVLSVLENEIKNEEFIKENTYLVNNLYLNVSELKTAIDLENDNLIRLKYMEVVKSL